MTASTPAIGRSTRTLTLGSVAAQGLSAVSQFLLVGWLAPEDFGLYATANAALVVLLAMTNLGEVNAYLTGRVAHPHTLLGATRRINGVLAVAGAGIAGVMQFLGRSELALVTLLVGLAIPLTGGSLAWTAIAIRASNLRAAIGAQLAGAVTKLAVGVGVASATQSALALPIAVGVGASVNALVARTMLGRGRLDGLQAIARTARDHRDQARWGAQSLLQFLGTQVDYLVLALLATPHLLGIYFLAYQATVGMSALVSGPLLKSGLVELGKSEGGDLAVTRKLGIQVSVYVAVFSALGGALVMMTSPYFPGAWSAAGSPLVMLLGSLAGRLLTPVLEAQLMASGRVGRSICVNAADILGTALAALAGLSGDVLLTALAVSTCKLSVAGLRCLAVFGGRRAVLILLPAITSLGAHAAVAVWLPEGSLVGAMPLLLVGMLITTSWHLRRRFGR